MLQIIGLTALFSLATVVSILLLGSRGIVGREMSLIGIARILVSWQFLLGAVFAFAARLLFMLINAALFKIPQLSSSSTTITTLIVNISLVFVIVANHIFLHERISLVQGVGTGFILMGIFLVAR